MLVFTFACFVFTADDNASITSSEQAAIIQTPEQSDNNTVSGFSNDFPESEVPPPQPMELEVLAAEERKKMVSSYENVYTGVPLEPTVNRMSMDASDMDIGDRFDTKQPDSKLQTGLSSSYEKLYDKTEDKSEDEGECISESTKLSSASTVIDVRSSFASTIHSSHPSTAHTSPVYITVESGLDKLACGTIGTTSSFAGDVSNSSRVKGDLSERSVSYDSTDTLDRNQESIFRPVSSPDVFCPVETGFPHISSGRGTSLIHWLTCFLFLFLSRFFFQVNVVASVHCCLVLFCLQEYSNAV